MMKHRCVAAPAAAFSADFKRYKPEQSRLVRKAEVKPNKVLDQLKEAWEKFSCDDEGTYHYQVAAALVRKIKYSAGDVERFSIAMQEFDENERNITEKAGSFLSALINKCPASDFIIHTSQLNFDIDNLGERNTKNIHVKGGVGNFLGYDMEYGTIIVEGKAGYYAGYQMASGEIHLQGDDKGTDNANVFGGRIYHKGKLIWPVTEK